jgi:hypothetical protein
VRRSAVFLIHPVVGWALCGATIGAGMATTTMENTLRIHAVAAPVIFITLSLIYFRNFGYTRPLLTAVLFTAIVMLLDFFAVALVIYHSLAMFESVLGTWIPFALIFVSTYLTGLVAARRRAPHTSAIPVRNSARD